jgi:hypothetical protein
MASEPTNTQRAHWTRAALAIFTDRTYSGGHPDSMDRDDFECEITDLICDLLHLARHEQFDAFIVHQRALTRFRLELLDEETRP